MKRPSEPKAKVGGSHTRGAVTSICDARRAFRRVLDTKQAANLLYGMQPYCLKAGQVHHPQALSVLALMTHAGWLTLPTVETCHPPTESGTFTLVALPPADANLEQCLTLLGHKATFKAKSASKMSDSDDEDHDHSHFHAGSIESSDSEDDKNK